MSSPHGAPIEALAHVEVDAAAVVGGRHQQDHEDRDVNNAEHDATDRSPIVGIEDRSTLGG
jgi:hypothetical protein